MKTYKEFEAEMTEEQRQKAAALFNSVFEDGPVLWCYSDRAEDAKHWKQVDVVQIFQEE